MSIDRRSFPRYPLTFPVKVGIDSHNEDIEFKASSVNVSRSSIEISCDNSLIEHLLAQDKYPYTCKLNFKVPNQSHIFEVESRVVTHRRLSQIHYHLVLIFPDFVSEKGDLLGEYLSALRPADNDEEEALAS
jgi:hypothetical protein